MKLPIREKYVDEMFPALFEFGEYPNGNVDLSNGQTDVITNIPPQIAEEIIAANYVFRQTLYKLLC